MENFEQYSARFLKKVNLSADDMLVDHYTSQGNILSIIKNENFRASHSNFMNDPDDANYFKAVMENAIFNGLANSENWTHENHVLIGKIFDDVDIYIGNLMEFCKNKINFSILMKLIQKMIGDFDQKIKTSEYEVIPGYYVISFSHYLEDGDLMLWRSYANDGKGGRITFSLPDLYKSYEIDNQFPKEAIHIYDCIYADRMKIKQIVSDCIGRIIVDIENFLSKNHIISLNDIDEKESVVDQFLCEKMRFIQKMSCMIKSHHYEGEKEVRLVIDSRHIDKEKFWASEKMIVPYVDFHFSSLSICSVSVGPRSDVRSSKSMLGFCYHHLVDKGLKRKNIYVDRSPVRYVGRD